MHPNVQFATITFSCNLKTLFLNAVIESHVQNVQGSTVAEEMTWWERSQLQVMLVQHALVQQQELQMPYYLRAESQWNRTLTHSLIPYSF